MKEDVPTTLPKSNLLEQLDASDRKLLTSFGNFLTFSQNDILITEGGPQDFLYFVVSGTLHATTRRSEILLGRITEGEWFGEVNVIDPDKASATVKARTPTCVWRISRSELEQFIADYPVLGAHILLSIARQLARRQRGVNKRLRMELHRAILAV